MSSGSISLVPIPTTPLTRWDRQRSLYLSVLCSSVKRLPILQGCCEDETRSGPSLANSKCSMNLSCVFVFPCFVMFTVSCISPGGCEGAESFPMSQRRKLSLKGFQQAEDTVRQLS